MVCFLYFVSMTLGAGKIGNLDFFKGDIFLFPVF